MEYIAAAWFAQLSLKYDSFWCAVVCLMILGDLMVTFT
jgi:hypothetical protein